MAAIGRYDRRVNASIGDLPETTSATAARLLAAANDLLTSRGARAFTIADLAKRAHVGKGTVYLYWPTKEDLLVGLIGRSFLSVLDGLIDRFDANPDLARPSRFCPTMLQTAIEQPLIAAMQRHDIDLLGALADHPRSMALDDALGPAAVLRAVLPLWRDHALARTDWDVADQAFALEALVTGVSLSLVDGPSAAGHRLNVLGHATTSLLGAERADEDQVRATAAGIMSFLREGRTAARTLIGPTP